MRAQLAAVGDVGVATARTWARPHPTVSVVVPAMNEAANLPHFFAAMPPEITEVILVDGHSQDATVAVARAAYPKVRIVHQRGQGKGGALLEGIAVATGDIVVLLDADGSTDPREIPSFVRALVESGADYAKGSRCVPDGGSADLTLTRRAGNRFLCAVANLLHRTRYTDLCYGFNACWRQVIPALRLPEVTGCEESRTRRRPRRGQGFEIEAILSLRAARAGLRVVEVPSFEHARLSGASNLRALRDGLRVLDAIRRERSYPARTRPALVESDAPEVPEVIDLRDGARSVPSSVPRRVLDLAALEVANSSDARPGAHPAPCSARLDPS